MKILVDINVLLDFYLGRNPNYRYASKIIKSYIKNNRMYYNCYVSSHTISTLLYCLRSPKVFKSYGYKISNELVVEFVNLTLKLFEVIPESKDILHNSVNNLDFKDKEDAIQYECAKDIRADFIVAPKLIQFGSRMISLKMPILRNFMESPFSSVSRISARYSPICPP